MTKEELMLLVYLLEKGVDSGVFDAPPCFKPTYVADQPYQMASYLMGWCDATIKEIDK